VDINRSTKEGGLRILRGLKIALKHFVFDFEDSEKIYPDNKKSEDGV
jgi:hypothetical protein